MGEYGNLEAGQDSDYFMVHMMAMTTENLRSKSDIAGELAYRDQRIEKQAAEITNLNAALKRVSDYNGRIEYQLAEQAAEIDRLRVIEEAAQTALKKHSKLVVNGVLGYTAYESEELENLAKALEVDDEH